ncbi:MAG: hypothetical protein WCE45_02395, partial [Sedimentisphaerales bacterium]
AMLLHGYLIDPIYSYMADIDRRIRGKGNPKSVGHKDVTDEITEMVKFLDKCKDEMIQGIKEQNGGKADLPNGKSAEIEPAPAKGSWIGNFFWKLYEKTLKVIVDAFLEKWWPK